ncbi:MAG: kelch repeat-containing protein [bacterium]
MKSNVTLLTVVCLLGLALAAGPAVTTSDVSQGEPQKIKLYYGTQGSNDYLWGTVNTGLPSDAWMLHSEMPGRMMDNACATDGNHVYVLAGYGTTNVLYRHAIGSTTWETKASCPLDISNGGAAIIGDTLYYCSGYSYTIGTTVDTMFKYCISTNTWTSGPGPFTGTTYNWQPLILACQGRLYYISGCNQPGATNPTRNVWCYTPGSGWAQVADMNQGRVFAMGCVYHDTIWVTGGYQNTTVLNHSEFYDPVSNTWTVDNSIFPQLPIATWAAASGVVGQTMFVHSGVSSAMALMDTTQYFDFDSRTWTVTPTVLLKVYRGTGVGNADGKAVVYGGSIGGFTPTDTCQYEVIATGNANDVGVIQIVAPGGVVTPGNITPRAKIKNFGTNAQSNIPVYCWIDSAGTRVYDQDTIYPGPLASGATADVDFSPQWYAVGGTYNVTMFTDLTGDEARSNDTMKGTTQVMQYTIDWYQSDTIQPDRVSRVACVNDAQGNLHVICGNCFPHTSHPYDQVYDTVANAWSQGLQHPAGGGVGVHNHDAVRIGDIIWVGGGSSSSGFYNNLTKLDLGAGTWTSATAMPQSNLLYYSFGEYADSGWVYCFGGSPGGTSGPINNCYRYDPGTNTWTAMANMPDVRRNPMVARVGDTIYVIGGMSANDYTSTRGTMWKYSVLDNSWTVASDSMPDKLGWGRAVTYSYSGGTYIYVFGGYRTGSVVGSCWRYDVNNNTWTADRSLLTTTRSHGGSISGNYIWVAGGYNTVILPNVQKGIISLTGVEEGKPSINWEGIEAVKPTLVRDICRISYNVPARGKVNLSIYDASGSLIRTLFNGVSEPGNQTVTWDRRDATGRQVASGTYFYRLTVDGRSVSAKAILLQ